MSEDESIIVCGRRITDYVLNCISRFNRGNKYVSLKAIGGNILKGVEVAHVLKSQAQGIYVRSCEISSAKVIGVETPCLDITLEFEGNRVYKVINEIDPGYIPYIFYSLFFDYILSKYGEIMIYRSDNIKLLELKLEDGYIKCKR